MKNRHIVLIANDVGGIGGMEKHLTELITRAKNDFSITVMASSMKLPEADGVRFIRIPTLRKPFPVMIVLFSVFASIRLLFLKQNLIHTTGAIVFNRVDVSTIHFCHRGYLLSGVQDRDVSKSLFHRINSAISMKMKLWLENHCYRPVRTRRLVAVSNRIKQELTTAYSRPESTVAVITNGVDITKFRPAGPRERRNLRDIHGLPEDGTILLFMGGDWGRKGLQFALQAFEEVAKLYPDVYMVVVGSGNADAFLHLISDEVRHRVIFAGRQANPENWYQMSDVFLFPSSYEACSLAVLEAAASGLAMVLTNVGGANDVVEDGVSGYLVRQDVAQIVSRLDTLLRSPAHMTQMRTAVRERVERMTWDVMYDRFRTLYEEILAESSQTKSRLETPKAGVQNV
ncbi:glycosyltransferase family 4 protein [Alicyclobacillus fastidiosus]|uniref:Glycosyltransferase family 4 protein n=1 Tax=Alicyclobacillus fastidiosus TaxID=392011 RepID=A0ABV5AAE1_9BACL|nr:glycosyltransferase family 4 protein [Alicyclobacillus fastidiosus]WEH07631.1 glycosyltransferase family 4 protein [Alicyclobacillus fastidiosus]